MPELPEVETTRRGILGHVQNRKIVKIEVRQANLRWKIDPKLADRLAGLTIDGVDRRGKYLLFRLSPLTLMVHLGMSGSLRIVDQGTVPGKHDHVDIHLEESKILRYHDPRRFGSVLLLEADRHPLLEHLGPEPLSEDFNAEYLYARSRKCKRPIKPYIMDGGIVVGVGNIYAAEALFLSAIRPGIASGRLSLSRYQNLVSSIKDVLTKAIEKGGTTLRDFVREDGQPGYFKQELFVYGRGGEPCIKCGSVLKEIRQAQRSTVYCAVCQK